MMVMAAGGDVNLANILSNLKVKSSSTKEKLDAYIALSNQLKENELSLFTLDVTKHAKDIVFVLKRDILDSSEDVCQVALQVLGFCLHDRDVVSALPTASGSGVMKSLCECILKTEDKITCTRALWCIAKQSLPVDDIKHEIHSILCAVEHSMEKWKSSSITVEHEAVSVIARLTEQHPKILSVHSCRWAKLLVPYIVHEAVKIRELVLETLTRTMDMVLQSRKDVVKDMLVELKTKICPEMKKLFTNKNEVFVLNAWSVVVQILGQELHHGSFINHMLAIVELGFKSSLADVKSAAFLAWQQLIDNFALNSAVVGDPKRIKLMMQVFRNNNAKVESVAMVKLKVWWHFIWLLGPKASLTFDQVCAPLLHFCVGGTRMIGHAVGTTPRVLGTGSSPATPRINLPSSSSHCTTFPTLQLVGCEVLSHFLGSVPDDLDLSPYSYTLDVLNSDIVTGAGFFLKQSNLLITTARELICNQGKDIPEGLLFRIWYCLIAHMKNAVESGAKSEIREALTSLLSSFQVIILSQTLSHQIVLKLFHAMCCLPKKTLCSTAYNMKSGAMIHGTPALFLTELLLMPSLLQLAASNESFFSLLTTLVNCGMGNPSGTLEFCQSSLQLLGHNASFIEDGEILWRLWSTIIHSLYEHITQTNEVNQGDALEYNFGCLYAALIFPITHRLPKNINPAAQKTLIKTWTDVYRTFARLSALVTNADANISCEDLCHRILGSINEEAMQDPSFLDFLVQICVVIITSVDFSSLVSNMPFSLSMSSPAKRNRRRQRPMENIHSFVMLMRQLVDSAMKIILPPEASLKKPASIGAPMPAIANGMVEILTVLFTHVSSDVIISGMFSELSGPVGDLFHGLVKKSGTKIYNNAFCQKLEKLWLDISTCIQGRYTGIYDTELLFKISPLLEATILHPRRAIKNQTTILWNSTFSHAAHLTYPESLIPVLTKVKDKTPIQLPGWISSRKVIVVEETPVSQMSQAESQVPTPHIPGMPSPHKIHGSFFNKTVSPNIKKSPARPFVADRAGGSSVKKRLSINELRDEAFVLIKSPPKKKRVLTDHQKEILKEKKAFPSMYTNLDVSQDVSLMTALNTDTQQSQTMDSPMDIGSSLDFSAFGKVLNKELEPKIESLKSAQSFVSADEINIPSKSTRRRSVRFKDSDSSSDVERENDKKIDAPLQEKEVSAPTNCEKPVEQNDAITSCDQSKESPFVQNVLVASAEDFSSTGKCSEKSNETVESGSQISQTIFTNANSVNISPKIVNEESYSPGKLISPSKPKSPVRKQSPARKLSQDALLSPIKSDRNKSSEKKLDGFGSLDQWLIRQPANLGKDEPKIDSSFVFQSNEDSVLLSVTVVEDTQSPTKFGQKSRFDGTNQPPIMETPPKDKKRVSAENPVSSRQLFTIDDDSEVHMDDFNIVPASPPSKTSLSIRSSPVVKPKKLIKSNMDKVEENKSNRDANKICTKTVNNINEKMNFMETATEEDSNSQGFQISDTSVDDTIGKSKELSFSQLVGTRQSDVKDTKNSQCSDCNVISIEQEDRGKIETDHSQISVIGENPAHSDILFSDSTSQASSEEYEPRLESTLRDLHAATGKDGVSDIEYKSDSVSSEKQCAKSDIDFSESETTYDPEQNSTLLDDKEHKRKQATPKKITIEAVRKSNRRRSAAVKYSPQQKNIESTPKTSKNNKCVSNETSKLNQSISENLPKENIESTKGRKMNRKSTLGTKSEMSVDDENKDKPQKVSSVMSPEEKTPEIKTQRTPGRKSTTKQKKEVAQRRSLMRDKILVNHGHTNLDMDSSDDEVTFKTSNEKIEKEINITTSDSSDDDVLLSQLARNARSVSESESESHTLLENNENSLPVSITTFNPDSSEDNLSLNNILESPIEKSTNDESGHLVSNTVPSENNVEQKRVISSEQNVTGCDQQIEASAATCSVSKSSSRSRNSIYSTRKKLTLKLSPMSTRLRSSGRVLRRQSKPIKRSLLKNVLRNAIETSNKASRKIKEDLVQTDKEIKNIGVSCDKVSDENQNVLSSVVQSFEITVELKESSESSSEKMPSSEMFTEDQALTENVVETSSIKKDTTAKSPNLEDTPKSAEKISSAFRTFLSNSDGKLLATSRKFERSPLVRRSIIKPVSSLGICTPMRTRLHDFRPIKGMKACSPSASPSAGILKRQRFSVGAITESPSPPNKQRRVSFAEPLILKKADDQRPPSPLVTCASVNGEAAGSKNSSSADNKLMTTQSDDGDRSQFQNGKNASQGTQSQSSYRSTQESQLNMVEPIYPELVQCQAEVDQVLPQLTSSIWSRGLGQLVRARNIHTIGDLSALTEREVHSLPIRSPKVATVRRVLQSFENRTKCIKQSPFAAEKTSDADKSERKFSSDRLPKIQEVEHEVLVDEQQVLPTLEDALSALSPEKGNVPEGDKMNTGDVEILPALEDAFSELSPNKEEGNILCPTGGEQSMLSVVTELKGDCNTDKLHDLSTEDIFKIYQHLNSITHAVVSALKTKCSVEGTSKKRNEHL